MSEKVLETVKRDRRFQELVTKRTRFAWVLSATMLVIYFGFIFIIAFAPKSLGTPIGSPSAFLSACLSSYRHSF